MISKIIGFVVVTLLAGCTGMMVVPPNTPGVTIEPITADLIQKMAANRESPRTMQVTPGVLGGQQEYQYYIQARDVLNILVWEHPELTIPADQIKMTELPGYLVSKEGTIFYPHVGRVFVAGKTLEQVRNIMTEKISEFIRSPQLDVRITNFRSQSAYVLGQVKKPGAQPITDVPLTLVRALGFAGGVTPEADMTGVTLKRKEKTFPIDLLAVLKDGNIAQNIILTDGDILHIPDQSFRKVYVMGELFRQESVLIAQNRRSMSLTEALSEVGGVNQVTSSPGQIYIMRGNPDKPDERNIFHLDAASPDALVLGDHFQLKPRDLVYVGTAGVTRWNRVISQLLPSQLNKLIK